MDSATSRRALGRASMVAGTGELLIPEDIIATGRISIGSGAPDRDWGARQAVEARRRFQNLLASVAGRYPGACRENDPGEAARHCESRDTHFFIDSAKWCSHNYTLKCIRTVSY